MLKYLSIIFCLFLTLNVSTAGTVLNGGVSYTVSEARTIAFDGIDLKIPEESFVEHMKDKKRFHINYEKTRFSDGTYVLNNKRTDRGYYYNTGGELILFDIKICVGNINRYARYDKNGMLDSVVLIITSKEQFIFDTNKKLVAHWIGKNGYNEKGELIKTRD